MKKETWQNYRQQAVALREQMTLEEKTSQLRFDSPSIERLGIPAYVWWNEALHGVARAGTATSFPQAIGMAASFDEDLIREMMEVVGEEGRAKYTESIRQGDIDIYRGLTFWCPNINIFRDPRWGRGHETLGEDPYLTGKLGVAYVKGLQGDGEHLLTAACLKHYAVHSGPEELRHSFDAVVSKKDLFETYLPAFEMGVKEGGAVGVMGAYNRVNGEVSCGSPYLLIDLLRKEWGFDGYTVSDCGAIADFHLNHQITKGPKESAALAIENGCDLNCGGVFVAAYAAAQEGLLSEEAIDRAVDDLLTVRIALGMFDGSEYDAIPYETVDSPEHHALALECARRSMVLLKNDGILPLDKKSLRSIAVIGPDADSREALIGNYFGDASEYVTVLDGIREAVGGDVRIYYAKGSHLYRDRSDGGARQDDFIPEALSAVEKADVTILCVGLDATIEGEQGDANNEYAAGDKRNLKLPPAQDRMCEAVLERAKKLGKKVIVLLMAGSAMDLRREDQEASAILDLWYPGALGGRAAAEILFGKAAPSGKLPVTFYESDEDLPDFEDYAMKNRTYRYFEGTPLYPFGYGLTYGSARLTQASAQAEADFVDDAAGDGKAAARMASGNAADRGIAVRATVENTGERTVREVVQVYQKNKTSAYAPLHPVLAGFRSVELAAGEKKEITIDIPAWTLKVVNEEGERFFDGNEYEFYVGFGQPDARTEQLTGQRAITISVMM